MGRRDIVWSGKNGKSVRKYYVNEVTLIVGYYEWFERMTVWRWESGKACIHFWRTLKRTPNFSAGIASTKLGVFVLGLIIGSERDAVRGVIFWTRKNM